ncbi:MAG: DNA internalization-related competence protein ComEC/Rec2 [Candidatus Sumerlaea chitinivorans]|nr:DNA internalization-related competence protein ComEC/Rec2 [Candidatus Sumerlaea chitinivorans]
MNYFKRPVIPCLILFIAGATLVSELDGTAIILVALLATLVAVWACALRKDVTPVFLLFFGALGGVQMATLKHEKQHAADILYAIAPPVSCSVQGRVLASDVESDMGRFRFVLANVELITDRGQFTWPGRLLVTFRSQGTDSSSKPPIVGEWVSAKGTLELPSGFQNFYGRNFRDALSRRRIYAVLRVSGTEDLQAIQPQLTVILPLYSTLRDVRLAISRTLMELLPEREGRLATSLLFNDRGVLRDEEIRVLRDSGTFHIFAVSGLHVGILAMILLVLGRVAGLRWRAAWTLVAGIVWLYVAMIGFPPPAWRAALMVSAVAFSRWLRREIDGVSTFAFACLVVVVTDLPTLYEPGFQLSAMGVFGILAFYPIFRQILGDLSWLQGSGWKRTLAGFALEGICLTFAVTLVLLPLQLYYFHRFNLLSPLTNIFASALAAPILGGALTTVTLNTFSSTLGAWAAAATAGLLRLLYALASLTADSSWALLRIPHPPLAVVFGYYAIILSGYYFVRRDSPEYVPKARARLTIHGVAACLLLVLCTAWQRADRTLRIWFFDVGQGDSILLQLPDGQSLLVDTGNTIPNIGRLVLEPQLSALGVYPLDNLVLTHNDSDHCGSAPYLLANWKIRRVVVPTTFRDVEQLFRQPAGPIPDSVPVTQVAAGYHSEVGRHLTLEVLNPEALTGELSSSNEGSLVFLIRYKQFSLLLTGDAEEAAENYMRRNGLAKADVLKVAHHGSASSTSQDFLNVVRPKVAVISCGQRNSYGHPHPVVLKRLWDVGARVFRTDEHGAVLVSTDGEEFKVETATGGN